MNVRAIALLLAGLCLGAGGLVSSLAWAQSDSAPPQADLDTKPIGKVLSFAGVARIEHAATVVVQANLPPRAGDQAKVGDLIYRGDMIQTGTDGVLSIVFADGTSFNVSKNARMEVNEFVYDPNGHSNSTLLSSDTRDVHFHRRQHRTYGQHESRYPVRNHGHSRDRSTR